MEKEIDWKEVAMEIFEEVIKLKMEVKNLSDDRDYWILKSLEKDNRKQEV